MIGRRCFLAGATAATTVAVLPLARAAGDPDAALRATLDGLAKLHSPAAKLKKLGGFDTQSLSNPPSFFSLAAGL